MAGAATAPQYDPVFIVDVQLESGPICVSTREIALTISQALGATEAAWPDDDAAGDSTIPGGGLLHSVTGYARGVAGGSGRITNLLAGVGYSQGSGIALATLGRLQEVAGASTGIGGGSASAALTFYKSANAVVLTTGSTAPPSGVGTSIAVGDATAMLLANAAGSTTCTGRTPLQRAASGKLTVTLKAAASILHPNAAATVVTDGTAATNAAHGTSVSTGSVTGYTILAKGAGSATLVASYTVVAGVGSGAVTTTGATRARLLAQVNTIITTTGVTYTPLVVGAVSHVGTTAATLFARGAGALSTTGATTTRFARGTTTVTTTLVTRARLHVMATASVLLTTVADPPPITGSANSTAATSATIAMRGTGATTTTGATMTRFGRGTGTVSTGATIPQNRIHKLISGSTTVTITGDATGTVT